MSQTLYCKKCNELIKSKLNYCTSCGNVISNNQGDIFSKIIELIKTTKGKVISVVMIMISILFFIFFASLNRYEKLVYNAILEVREDFNDVDSFLLESIYIEKENDEGRSLAVTISTNNSTNDYLIVLDENDDFKTIHKAIDGYNGLVFSLMEFTVNECDKRCSTIEVDIEKINKKLEN